MTGETIRMMRWLVVVALVAAGGVSGGGCAYHRKMDVPIAAPVEGWPVRSAVDIHNFHGSVTVIVDPRLERVQPSARAGVRQAVERGLQWRPAEAVSVVMDVVEQEGGSVLKVRTGAMWHNPDDVWVDLVIRMPACNGAVVWNRGGPVELVGVSGAVQVENGPLEGLADGGEGRSAGGIEVRTAQPMTEPVALVTKRGTVRYHVGRGSSGRFELLSGDRRAEFYGPAARADEIRGNGQELRVIVNGGANPVLLRSEKGLVRAAVLEDPEGTTDRLR